MAGHGEKLTRKQEQAIAALISEPTVAKAAKTAGVGENTLYKWMKKENFKNAYDEARKQVMDQSLTYLQSVIGKAVETLEGVMMDPNAPASAKVSAAKTCIENSIKVREVQELEQRINEIEEQMNKDVS